MKPNSLETLSLCMIARNEEANLPRCFKSVQAIADEIIIVDTGSTDRTPAIAAVAGARIIRARWRDDFSDARNISLAAANCSWILWLDADDELDGDAAAKIIRIKKEQIILDTAFGFSIKNVKAGGIGESFLQVRMFPRDGRVFFERRVHEQINPSLKRNGYKFIYFPEIVVNHLGYSSEKIRKEKALRNRAIILQPGELPGHQLFCCAGGLLFYYRRMGSGDQRL